MERRAISQPQNSDMLDSQPENFVFLDGSSTKCKQWYEAAREELIDAGISDIEDSIKIGSLIVLSFVADLSDEVLDQIFSLESKLCEHDKSVVKQVIGEAIGIKAEKVKRLVNEFGYDYYEVITH